MISKNIPTFHFITNNFEMLFMMKTKFFNKPNIIIDSANIIDEKTDNNIFVSLTSCIVGEPTCIDKIFLEKFNHETRLNEEIGKLTRYSNSNTPYIPYGSLITIQLETTRIMYIPIRFSSTSNIPINHIFNAISTVFEEIKKIEDYIVDKVIIPLDGIENFATYNINVEKIVELVYESYIRNIRTIY